MKELLQEDTNWCLVRLPKIILKLLKDEPKKVMLAGGFIRACIANEKTPDIDLFAQSKDSAELYARRLAEKNRLVSTDNAFTIIGKKPTVQFIHKWVYAEPADIIPSFDFTIARATIWFDGDKWQSLCDDRYYADLAAKRLVYCSPKRIEEAGGSLLRVLKFYQRGYRIPLDSLAAVVARLITGVNIEKIETEEDWAYVLTGLLREVDPQIDLTGLAHLLSKNEAIHAIND